MGIPSSVTRDEWNDVTNIFIEGGAEKIMSASNLPSNIRYTEADKHRIDLEESPSEQNIEILLLENNKLKQQIKAKNQYIQQQRKEIDAMQTTLETIVSQQLEHKQAIEELRAQNRQILSKIESTHHTDHECNQMKVVSSQPYNTDPNSISVNPYLFVNRMLQAPSVEQSEPAPYEALDNVHSPHSLS